MYKLILLKMGKVLLWVPPQPHKVAVVVVYHCSFAPHNLQNLLVHPKFPSPGIVKVLQQIVDRVSHSPTVGILAGNDVPNLVFRGQCIFELSALAAGAHAAEFKVRHGWSILQERRMRGEKSVDDLSGDLLQA